MTKQQQTKPDDLSAEETIRRRDEAVRKALNTPPKPYKDSKVGNSGKKQRIVLELPLTLPAEDAARQLTNFLVAYSGDKDALRFGYWDSGEALVVAAPETTMTACPAHAQKDCVWCYATGRVTSEFATRLERAKASGEIGPT